MGFYCKFEFYGSKYVQKSLNWTIEPGREVKSDDGSVGPNGPTWNS